MGRFPRVISPPPHHKSLILRHLGIRRYGGLEAPISWRISYHSNITCQEQNGNLYGGSFKLATSSLTGTRLHRSLTALFGTPIMIVGSSAARPPMAGWEEPIQCPLHPCYHQHDHVLTRKHKHVLCDSWVLGAESIKDYPRLRRVREFRLVQLGTE